MLIRTVGFLLGGERVRLIIVIRQGMRGENLEGWECKQRLDLEHSPQGRDQRGQADRQKRQVKSRGEDEWAGVPGEVH